MNLWIKIKILKTLILVMNFLYVLQCDPLTLNLIFLLYFEILSHTIRQQKNQIKKNLV